MCGRIADKLARSETIIIDGGTGTDIQRRDVPINGDTWCAEANLTHPHIVRAVHDDYVKAGAEVIIANTFATSPLLFNAIGRDDDLLQIDHTAVAIARDAARRAGVAAAAIARGNGRPMRRNVSYLSAGWRGLSEARRIR